MAGYGSVYIKSGEQPRFFNFGRPDSVITSVAAAQVSQPLYKESVFATFQAMLQGTGAVTATATLQVSNDDNTGRGYVFAQNNYGPGTVCTVTSASTALVSPAGGFTSAMVGALVVAAGVPIGTTIASVTNPSTAVMSATATASGSVQTLLYATNWCTTALGVITLNGTGNLSDGFTTTAPWRYVRASLSNITGTVTGIQLLMGC